MTDIPVAVDEVPLPPDDRPCSGGCGKNLKPEWFPGAGIGNVRLKAKWFFEDPCEPCRERRAREDDEREDRAKKSDVRRQLVELLGGEAVADRYTFDRYFPKTDSQRFALSEARQFSPSTENLFLWSRPSGTGKSHLAGAILRAALYAGMSVLHVKASRLARPFQKLDHQDYEKALKRHVMTDLFVLDDLGVGNTTEFALSVLYDIVDERELKGRKGLVVTSNLSLGLLTERFKDDRLSSRLLGLCRGHVIEVDGPDGRAE